LFTLQRSVHPEPARVPSPPNPVGHAQLFVLAPVGVQVALPTQPPLPLAQLLVTQLPPMSVSPLEQAELTTIDDWPVTPEPSCAVAVTTTVPSPIPVSSPLAERDAADPVADQITLESVAFAGSTAACI
jgi:hypothetical protein